MLMQAEKQVIKTLCKQKPPTLIKYQLVKLILPLELQHAPLVVKYELAASGLLQQRKQKRQIKKIIV